MHQADSDGQSSGGAGTASTQDQQGPRMLTRHLRQSARRVIRRRDGDGALAEQAEQWALRQKSQLRSRARVKLQKDAFDLQWMRQLEMRLADRQPL